MAGWVSFTIMAACQERPDIKTGSKMNCSIALLWWCIKIITHFSFNSSLCSLNVFFLFFLLERYWIFNRYSHSKLERWDMENEDVISGVPAWLNNKQITKYTALNHSLTKTQLNRIRLRLQNVCNGYNTQMCLEVYPAGSTTVKNSLASGAPVWV